MSFQIKTMSKWFSHHKMGTLEFITLQLRKMPNFALLPNASDRIRIHATLFSKPSAMLRMMNGFFMTSYVQLFLVGVRNLLLWFSSCTLQVIPNFSIKALAGDFVTGVASPQQLLIRSEFVTFRLHFLYK